MNNPAVTNVDSSTEPPSGVWENQYVVGFDAFLDDQSEKLRGNTLADSLGYGLSAAGDHGMIWHVISVLRALLPGGKPIDVVIMSSALGAEAALVNGPIKWMFRRERPYKDNRPFHLRNPRTSSFPSGHASAAMFSAVLLGRRSRVSWPWYVLALGLGWSRVHVKIHHPSDIVGGFAVGLVLGKIADRVIVTVFDDPEAA